MLVSGADRVDEEALAKIVGGQVERATAEFVRARTGYAIGGVPPLAHTSPVVTYLDEHLLAHAVVWAAAGTPRAVFPIAPSELLRVTSATLVAVASIETWNREERFVSSSCHDEVELAPASVSEVADGVFAYIQPDGTWWINNTGFIRGNNTVVSIDTCSTERADSCLSWPRWQSSTGQVPRILVNTHHHGDHTNGNCFLPFATVDRPQATAGGRCKKTGID